MNAKDIRKKHKEKREKCFICGGHETITELHHIRTLKDCAEELEYSDTVESSRVWLCPNHHRYIHKIFYIRKSRTDKECLELADFLKTLSEEEKHNLEEINKEIRRNWYE